LAKIEMDKSQLEKIEQKEEIEKAAEMIADILIKQIEDQKINNKYGK
jgi:hypothetical protein